MTSLILSIRRSLFLRLLLIFGTTLLLFLIIIAGALRFANNSRNTIDAIPDFFTRNIDSIIDIESIGSPPNLANAMRLAEELGWTIQIRSPIMRWSSDTDNRIDVTQAEFDHTLSADAEIRRIGGEDIIMVERGGYEFYLYQRAVPGSGITTLALYAGFAFAALALLLNYIMVNRLLAPVRLLKQGAERIRNGDLGFRVDSDRQDELGELTQSINHMADSLQSMLEAKRALLLAISHELRSPLAKAKLRLEFIEEGEHAGQLREDINEIDLLIADLIEAERLNQEHAALVAETVGLGGFVRSVTAQYVDYAGSLEVKTPKPDREFDIDKLRIRLLLTNLLNNAVRHGGNNPITVAVSFPGEEALIEVIDRGEGIAKPHLSKVAEPFYRADRSRRRDTGGTGLGLYLCHLIAEAHGGKLEIDSEPGRGTRVSVTLPRRAAAAPAGSTAQAPAR
ncbi:MAG: HAMP domain-containing sensor histidine kinase [Gammaproteobacteria bacterium]|nr:HAMP domain-containing sensor histidine kinase [Gammaproteobacteria bacterium]MCY4182723.1 HAMP domain-containing sensor histidine kinase [Gammaproteobacteria bacterium]MCY4297631.1 HAMP domain-containing sensor histidine kinase [Gammaproteobacteria bacterium]